MTHLTVPVAPGDHTRGDEGALVTLLEYADFECPFSGPASRIVPEVMRRMGGQVRLVFRHFPLSQKHPRALSAAEAAEAAGAQGHFWPMHDLLFQNQDALDLEDLITYAESLHLDLGRFVSDLEIHARLDRVKRDFHAGVSSGVDRTPTFFIDGVRHEGAWDPDTLTAALQRALGTKHAA